MFIQFVFLLLIFYYRDVSNKNLKDRVSIISLPYRAIGSVIQPGCVVGCTTSFCKYTMMLT